MSKGILALLLAFLAVVSAQTVLELTSENFDETIKSNDVVMVEFYAPWCGHCKNLAPKYDVAANDLGEVGKLAKVDCTAEAALCQEYEIRGYPTIKVFRSGHPTDYQGPRESDAIVTFMRRAILPPVVDVDAASYISFADSNRIAVVGFFESKESDEYTVFYEVAKRLNEKISFAASTDAAAAGAAGVTVPSVVIHKKFDDLKNEYDGAFETSALSSFITTAATPLMDDIGPENYGSYVESGLPLAYLFVATPEQRTTEGAYCEKLAKEYKGKINFVYIDANQYGAHANNLNLKLQWPAFAIQDPVKNTKFPFVGTLSEDAITQFVKDFSDGKASPSLKSEDIPESQTGPVTVVVGKSYESVVLDKTKDVLIEFYAPWCGHCKKLEPTYNELGTALAENPNFVIAKMDATANDLPADAPFRIQGFPTIKLVKAEDNSVVDFNGDRSVDGFITFLKANAVHGSTINDDEVAAAEEAAAKDEL